MHAGILNNIQRKIPDLRSACCLTRFITINIDFLVNLPHLLVLVTLAGWKSVREASDDRGYNLDWDYDTLDFEMGPKQHWKEDKKTNVNVKRKRKKEDHLCVKSCLFVCGGKHTWGREHKWSDLKHSLEQHLQIPKGHSLHTSKWDSPSKKRKTHV